ncbi:hypothetical protein M8J77_014529 [Diaphorina citri]|nr:hypothetical protein M8J77_014529 [Diaphorina citri]
MWCYRKTLKIVWSDRVTNEEVLERVKERRQVMNNISARRAKWIGHNLRHEGMLLTLIEGMVEGTNQRGRPRKEYIRDVETDMGCQTYMELKRLAQNRNEWRRRSKMLLPTNRQIVT